MLPLTFARQRVRSLLAEIGRLKDADFPYSHSRDALGQIENAIQKRLESLDSLTDANDPTVVRTACAESLLEIFRCLPLLGFIVRSTDVRNSFEVFGPLLRLAREILSDQTKLIVSSEWEFSPHVYPPSPSLPGFVLLGLPASESENPLLVPLAGHELGHSTWSHHSLGEQFRDEIWTHLKKEVTARHSEYENLFGGDTDDLFVAQNLDPAYQWAMRQSEETFCDLFGLKLFAEAYLFAFAYVVSPGVGERNPFYPSMDVRVANLIHAAARYEVDVRSNYSDWFEKESLPIIDEKERFLLQRADDALSEMFPRLIEHVDKITKAADLPPRTQEKMGQVEKSFQLLTPAASIDDLTNILNAAWRLYDDKDLWNNIKVNRLETLSDLALKSIEILEYEQRTK